MIKEGIKIKIGKDTAEHCKTGNMPNDPKYKYKAYCREENCNNVIAQAEKPFDLTMTMMLSNAPCSECMNPLDYAMELAKNT